MKWSIPSMMVARSPTYFLETFPGAAVAYSLRKLRTPQVYAIRVRRDNDNAEQDIGFSGGGLDVVSLAAFVGSNSGYITKWYDQSGNSNHAIQSNTTYQPQIVSAGTIITRNSLPSIRFNSQYMDLTSGVSGTFPWSSFIVQQRNGSGTMSMGLNSTANSIPFTVLMYIDDNTYVADNSGTYFFDPGLTDNNFVLHESHYTASVTQKCYINTIDKTPGGSNTISAGTTFDNIGARTALVTITDSWCSEIIFYGSNQTSNRSAIESNINAYYLLY